MLQGGLFTCPLKVELKIFVFSLVFYSTRHQCDSLFFLRNVPKADPKAQKHYNKAIEQAKKVGDRGTFGRCYLDLGILHRAKKRLDRVRKSLIKAIEIFEETEAEVYLKQAKGEM